MFILASKIFSSDAQEKGSRLLDICPNWMRFHLFAFASRVVTKRQVLRYERIASCTFNVRISIKFTQRAASRKAGSAKPNSAADKIARRVSIGTSDIKSTGAGSAVAHAAYHDFLTVF